MFPSLGGRLCQPDALFSPTSAALQDLLDPLDHFPGACLQWLLFSLHRRPGVMDMSREGLYGHTLVTAARFHNCLPQWGDTLRWFLPPLQARRTTATLHC